MMYEGSQIEDRKDTVSNKDGKAYCIECGRRTKYYISSALCTQEVRGAKFAWVNLNARCAICGKEVYIPEVNDANVNARELSYKMARTKHAP